MTIFDFICAAKSRLDRFERASLLEKGTGPAQEMFEDEWWELFENWDIEQREKENEQKTIA